MLHYHDEIIIHLQQQRTLKSQKKPSDLPSLAKGGAMRVEGLSSFENAAFLVI